MKRTIDVFKRVLAKILDYTFFASILFALSMVFSLDSMYFFIITLPFFWVVIESVLIARFSTTPGKALLRLSVVSQYNRRLSLLQSLQRSLLVLGFIVSLAIPPIGIYCAYKELQRYRRAGLLSWDAKMHTFVSNRKVGAMHVMLSCLAIAVASLPFTYEAMEELFLEKNTPFFKKIEKASLPSGQPLRWKPFTSPSKDFAVQFPEKNPRLTEKKLPIPNSNQSLEYREYATTPSEGISFSVSYTTLPSNLLKWSPNLVLKATTKIIAKHLTNARLIKTKSVKAGALPAIDYTMQRSGETISGRLFLVNTTLYKVEIVYPSNEAETALRILPAYLDSFRVIAS